MWLLVYWFAISGGKCYAGWEDLPDWVRALKGFHIAACWGKLAGPSGAIYGPVGSALRNYHSGILDQRKRTCNEHLLSRDVSVRLVVIIWSLIGL